MPLAVEAAGVTKRFRLHTDRSTATTLKTAVLRRMRRLPGAANGSFAALSDVDLRLEAGRALGVIGANGSGKSTLLRILAGIYRPDSGRVAIQGRVAALIELGAGFHPEFSGRENVILNGTLLGLSRREVLERLDRIVAFAELGMFIDEPARTYSSGMLMRLGFSVAVHLDPDVLLLDEVLAIGDEGFARKCAERIAAFRRSGRTLVLVTHDLAAVERWCDEAIWLDHGRVRLSGLPRRVIDEYRAAVDAEQSGALAEAAADRPSARRPHGPADDQRWGTGEIEITNVRLLDAGGAERYVYRSGEPVRVHVSYGVRTPVADAVFGFAVMRADGLWVYGTNTALAGVAVPPLGASGILEIALERLDLVDGSYFLDVAVHAPGGHAYDYRSRSFPFAVQSGASEQGVARLRHRWAFGAGPASP